MTLNGLLEKVGNDYPRINFKTLSKSSSKISASFVIPCFNARDTLTLSLSAIDNQLLADNIAEVVIIDDGSTDITNEIVERVQSKYNYKIIYEKNEVKKGAAFSRNKGVNYATGEVICFIDSDIIIPPDYLNLHLTVYEKFPNSITLSMRSFVDKENFLSFSSPFPVKNFINEFRIEKNINPEWCNTKEKLIWAGRTIYLLSDSDNLRKLGNGNCIFWSLPEVCLTNAMCYKRSDLLKVKGAPDNFIGWGFDDISMAAKVISLGNFVIPIIDAGVYHLNHIKKSTEERYKEFEINRAKYYKMLEMEQEDTFKEHLEGI